MSLADVSSRAGVTKGFLSRVERDETLLIQSGKPVGVVVSPALPQPMPRTVITTTALQ